MIKLWETLIRNKPSFSQVYNVMISEKFLEILAAEYLIENKAPSDYLVQIIIKIKSLAKRAAEEILARDDSNNHDLICIIKHVDDLEIRVEAGEQFIESIKDYVFNPEHSFKVQNEVDEYIDNGLSYIINNLKFLKERAENILHNRPSWLVGEILRK